MPLEVRERSGKKIGLFQETDAHWQAWPPVPEEGQPLGGMGGVSLGRRPSLAHRWTHLHASNSCSFHFIFPLRFLLHYFFRTLHHFGDIYMIKCFKFPTENTASKMLLISKPILTFGFFLPASFKNIFPLTFCIFLNDSILLIQHLIHDILN